jgi:hypothetical protein
MLFSYTGNMVVRRLFMLLVAFGGALALGSACDQLRAHVAADSGYRAYLEHHFDDAASDYARAEQLLPDNIGLCRNLALAHLSASRASDNTDDMQRHLGRSIDVLRRCIDLDRRDPEIMELLFNGWVEGNRLDEAAAYFRGEWEKGDVESLRMLGVLDLQRHSYAEAFETFKQRIALQPDNPQAYAVFATVCWEWLHSGRLVDRDEALQVCNLGLEAAYVAKNLDHGHPSALNYAVLLMRERAIRADNEDDKIADLTYAGTLYKWAREGTSWHIPPITWMPQLMESAWCGPSPPKPTTCVCQFPAALGIGD